MYILQDVQVGPYVGLHGSAALKAWIEAFSAGHVSHHTWCTHESTERELNSAVL